MFFSQKCNVFSLKSPKKKDVCLRSPLLFVFHYLFYKFFSALRAVLLFSNCLYQILEVVIVSKGKYFFFSLGPHCFGDKTSIRLTDWRKKKIFFRKKKNSFLNFFEFEIFKNFQKFSKICMTCQLEVFEVFVSERSKGCLTLRQNSYWFYKL